MKISSLLICLATLGLGVGAYIYTANQGTTMKMVIAASGGADETNLTGLRQVNHSLDVEVATLSKERQDAIKTGQGALAMMQHAREEREASFRAMEAATAERDEWIEKIKEMESRLVEVRAEEAKMLEFLRTLPALGEDVELSTAVDKLRGVVEEEVERRKNLTKEHEEKVEVRKAASEKVAGETLERNRMEAINNRFFENYTKNEDEFPVLSVNPQWRIVVFNVGENSGLVPGKTNPMMVRRGNEAVITLRIVSINNGMVTAEYNKDDLPRGVYIRPGDIVFRQKPVGN